MQVERMPLPGAATVVVFGVQRRALVDSTLSRDQAVLALTGVLPEVHPDVVDHWLDNVFERRRLPFSARQMSALFGAATLALALAIPAMPGAHRPHRRVTPIAVMHMQVATDLDPLPV